MIQKSSNFEFHENRKIISKSVLIPENLKDHESNQNRFERIDKKIRKIEG